MAAPILYDSVEVKSLDGLVSLFFLEDEAPTDRLDPPVSLLSRIRTLTLSIRNLRQWKEPRFNHPNDEAESDDDEEDFFGNLGVNMREDDLLCPLRIQRSVDKPLSLPRLILCSTLVSVPPQISEHLLFLLSTQVFPFLSPRQVTHRCIDSSREAWWCNASFQMHSGFLSDWDELERVVLDGQYIQLMMFEADYEELPLYSLWSRRNAGEGKAFELVFDFASRGLGFDRMMAHPSLSGRMRLGKILEDGGLTKETSESVELDVVLRVRREDEAKAREEMGRDLEEWMKGFVRVELAE